MNRKKRKIIFLIGTGVLILIMVLLAVGFITLLADALNDFSVQKVLPLTGIVLGIISLSFRLKRIRQIFKITEIMNEEENEAQ